PIQRLQIWYFKRQDLNVETLFPNAPYIQLLNPILARCVVEHERDCLPDATALLEEIDNALNIIQRNADTLCNGATRRCKACGLGNSKPVEDENTYQCLGLCRTATWQFRVERCDRCGYVEVFVSDIHDRESKKFVWPDGLRSD